VSGREILHAHVDGASRGNPGEASFGVHVTTPDGRTVVELFGLLGRATNNVAEYHGLLHALRWVVARGAGEVEIFSDSELLVRQVSGRYRVRSPGLKALHGEACELMARLDHVRISHVPREENRRADALANRALDEHVSKLE
jgi:ribonuclease HI